MKYMIMLSDVSNDDKIFCENESEATAVIEQKVRDGVSESDISVFLMQPVSFQVERVPVAKLSDSAIDAPASAPAEPVASAEPASEPAVSQLSDEPEVPDFRARAMDTANPFLSEQVFSLDS
jgi:hypothetical protein